MPFKRELPHVAKRAFANLLGMDARISILRQMPRSSVCAEIGVWKGEFSERIRRETTPRELHLIDPWTFQSEFPDRMYGGKVAKSQADMDAIYEVVRERFYRCSDVFVHRGTSEVVLDKFDDAWFDWVYIDGNHRYRFALSDLRLCFSKVKEGGVIAGDDYNWGKKEGFPVKRAVMDFVEENNLEDRLRIKGSQYLIKL